MAMVCWALGKTSVPFVGLCHGVQTTLDLISGYVDVPKSEIDFLCAGINHMAWFLRSGARGQGPLSPAARALRAARVLRQRKGARRGLPPLRLLHDRVHRPSVRVPALVPQEPEGARPVLRRARLWRRDGRLLQLVRVRRATSTATRTSWPTNRSNCRSRSIEYGSYVIEALETGRTFKLNGNVINDGMITNLPADCCAEGPIYVDRMGLHKTIVGDLPPQCAALNLTNINVQRLAVEAALTGDPEHIVQACALDPLTAAVLTLKEIREMATEMLEAERSGCRSLRAIDPPDADDQHPGRSARRPRAGRPGAGDRAAFWRADSLSGRHRLGYAQPTLFGNVTLLTVAQPFSA